MVDDLSAASREEWLALMGPGAGAVNLNWSVVSCQLLGRRRPTAWIRSAYESTATYQAGGPGPRGRERNGKEAQQELRLPGTGGTVLQGAPRPPSLESTGLAWCRCSEEDPISQRD